MSNVFKIPKNFKLPKKVTNEIAFPFERMQELLERFEEIEREQLQLQEEHEDLFSHIESLEDEKETIRQQMKRLAYTKTGPPGGVDGKTFVPCKGGNIQVKVTYRQKSSYYNPSALPPGLLLKPGIINGVDSLAIEALLPELGKKEQIQIERAKQVGEWMTPSVTVERTK